MIEILEVLGTLPSFLLWALLVLAVFCAVFALSVMHGIRVINKMLVELPRFTWLTLEEVTERGYSPFWCKVALPSLYKDGFTEVTPIEGRVYYNYHVARHKRLGVYDYRPATIHDFYFRIVRGGGTRKRKKKIGFIPFPTPQPIV